MALALDLQLRGKGLNLDDFMKAVWAKHGKPEIAYNVADLEVVLAAYTKDKMFAQQFFAKYINGHESLDYTPLLGRAGLLLKKQFEGQAWIGDIRYKDGTGLTITTNTVIGSPLYKAGLDIDDEILKVDGRLVSKTDELTSILKTHKPGDQITVEYAHRGETKTAVLDMIQNPRWEVVTYEQAGKTVTPEMETFRKAWLGSKWK